ncbi:MAG: imidazolonepropionase [Myxococcota bacterium]
MIPVMAALAALTAPSNSPEPAVPTIIEDVRVETGDGRVIEHAHVVIAGGRIKHVAPSTGIPVDLEGERIRAAGKTLTPGLIETRSNLGLVEISLVKPTRDFSLAAGNLKPGFAATDGFNPASVLIPIARAGGITSAIASPRGGIIAGTGSWIELTGRLDSRPDPAAPVAMFGAVGERAAAGAGGARGGVWLRLRQLVEDTRFYRANRASFSRGQARPLILSPLDLEAMIPVIEGRLPLVLEAHRASDILTALEFAQTNRIRLVILGGTEAWRVTDELVKAKVPVILTPSEAGPWGFEALGARDDAAALLERAGVTLILSSGGWTHNMGRLRQEAGIAVAYGLPHAAAIRAITSRPAEVFGHGKDLGVIAQGMRANVVLWSGDPLEVTTVATAVWIDGVRQSLDTRQRRLVDRYLSR